MAEGRTVTVHIADNEMEAQSIVHLLEQAEIPHFTVGIAASAGYMFKMGNAAQVPIRVLEQHEDEARELITAMMGGDQSPDPGSTLP